MFLHKPVSVLVCLWAFLLFATPASAQFRFFSKVFSKTKNKPKPIPTYKPEQLREDFAIFRKSLEEAHPGLYRYTSVKTFNARFDSVSATLNRPMTEQEFYAGLQLLVSQIRCGHTKLIAPKREQEMYPYFTDQLFPLEPYFSDGKAYVLNTFSDSVKVPLNAEIIAINGQKTDKVVQMLLPFVSAADGLNTASRYLHLGDNFSGYYAAFIEAKPSNEITFRTSEGKTKTVQIPAVKLEQIKQIKQREAAFKKLPELSLNFEEKTAAVLTVSTFAPAKTQDFEQFLEDAFERIKGSEVKNLIIDLRDNTGENSENGALLYRYLTDKPFKYYRLIKTNTNKRFTFMKYAHVPWYFAFYRRLLKTETDGTFKYVYHDNLKEQKPQPNPFTGNLYVLINGRTFGTAGEFAAVAFSNKRATFIGQKTAGAYQGNNSGKFVHVKLPNSKLELDIPLWAVYLAVDEKQNLNHGVIPQHIINPTTQELQTGHDSELKFTLDLIRK